LAQGTTEIKILALVSKEWTKKTKKTTHTNKSPQEIEKKN